MERNKVTLSEVWVRIFYHFPAVLVSTMMGVIPELWYHEG